MATGEAALPIDINYNKLADWLIDRKWVKEGYQDQCQQIRTLINNAIQDMPDVEEITTLLSGAYITYFHCLRIVELLKVSEADTRNIFGRYSSQRMKDWQEILRRYQQDNAYLGECAQLVQHNVNYEITAMKKTISRGNARIQDATRRETEYTSTAANYKQRFESACRDYDIPGQNLVVEIQSLAAKLPSLYEQAVTLSQGQVFREAVAYYTDFLQFTLAEGLSKSEPKILRPMQLLNFVARHGNTSVHFMQAGQEPAQSACETEGKPSACQITTEGDGVTVESQPDADIDWGIEETSISEAAADTGTIDWGEDVAGIVIEGTDGSGIVWSGDATSAAGAAGGIDSGDNAVVAAATPSGACSGSGITSSILEHSPTRNEYVDQLLELQGFLAQRLVECKGDGNVVLMNQFVNAPNVVQMQNAATVQAMLDIVGNCLDSLTSLKAQQLIMIGSSPRYVERLAGALAQKRDLSHKMLLKATELRKQREELAAQIQETYPKLERTVAQIKILQRQVEQDISQRYDHRPVHLIGEINTV